MDTKFDDILIHHGVKGMRWGVRNRKNKPELSKKQKRNRNIKIAAGVTGQAPPTAELSISNVIATLSTE